MMNDSNLDPNSFNQAYAILKENADLLSKQQEPDIDGLLPLVEKSMRAYNICKNRLEAVRQALEQHLSHDMGEKPVNLMEKSPWDEEESMEPNPKVKTVNDEDLPF